MKVSILTWYKALNHGAILQAYASQEYIRSLGVDTEILDYKREVQDSRRAIDILNGKFKKVISGDFKYRNRYYSMDSEKRAVFDAFISKEVYVQNNWNNLDCVMIGSDMVFNLLQGYSPYMFGNDINSKYLFSYAACSGGTTIDIAKRMGLETELEQGLRRFSGLSSRDQTTTKFLTDITGRTDVKEHVDPVLLYGFEKEKDSWDSGKWELHKPYILVYSYSSNMNERKEVQTIVAFAKRNDYDIISCGYYHPWCDISVNADPKEFLEMVLHAQAIITDTFHGTVFSLICQKPFCSVIRGNGYKVEYLLSQCRLDTQIARDCEEIGRIISQQPVFEEYQQWITDERDIAKEYLASEVKKAEIKANEK